MKTKTNWKEKFSSRKFLIAAAPILIFLLTAMFGEEQAQQIVGLIGAAIASLGYVFSEAKVDMARADVSFSHLSDKEQDERFGKNGEYCQYTIDAIANRIRELEGVHRER